METFKFKEIDGKIQNGYLARVMFAIVFPILGLLLF